VNIFVTDPDPRLSAEVLCNRHVVKMTLETAQLLSSAVRLHAPEDHLVGDLTRENFRWTVRHGLALAAEYSRRYGKEHASARIIRAAAFYDQYIPDGPRTVFALAMPDEFKPIGAALDDDAACKAYRMYIADKYATWKRVPRWVRA
jgi:hypothetical protein